MPSSPSACTSGLRRRFGDVLDDAPDNDYAHYALGRCLLRLGRADEARAHLRLARALRPQSDLYREALNGLR